MSGSVAKFGGRAVTFIAAAAVVAGSLAATVDNAEARSKKRNYYRSIRPAAAATFTGAPNYAAMVVDAKTGRTLYEKNADATRFPASVTKVMTLYLVFEDLERGRIRLNSEMAMSSRCAAMAPSKLGLRPGQTISVEDGIKALVTKSANDVACAFGDALEGSESAFADRMTRKARAIGMNRTIYRNASGLPNADHVTSARDLVTLGRSIQDRFPRYYGYFSTRVFAYGRQRIGNHNRLLGRVEGVDGIKTGYTNASGFNLLTSVKWQGRSVVAVVMGGRTGASRDNHMRELLALNLPKAQPGARTAPLVAEAIERPPVFRARPPVMAGAPAAIGAASAPTAERVASLDALTPLPPAAPRQPAPVHQAAAVSPPSLSSGGTPKSYARPAAVTEEEDIAETEPTPAREIPPVAKPMRWVVGAAPSTTGSVAQPAGANDLENEIAEPSDVPAPRIRQVAARAAEPEAAPVAETGPVRKGWMIQIGATTEPSAAKSLLDNAKAKGGRMLTSAEPFTETYIKGATTYYRARFAGLNERSADAACKALKRSSVSCFAIKN